MKAAFYLIRLYPQLWRERYEEEFLAMLEQSPLSFADGVNLLFGALDAQLHPHLGATGISLYKRIGRMFSTLRRSLLAIFCAYVGFILAGWAFQKMTEYTDFKEVARTNDIVGLSFQLIILGAIVALVAILVGGLPIAAAVVRSALARKQRGLILLMAVPVLAFAVLLGTTFFLKALNPFISIYLSPGWQHLLQRSFFFGTLIVTAIVSTGSVYFAVARSDIPEKLLRFALFPSLLITISMAMMLLATIIWGLSLSTSAPQLFTGNDGLVGSSTTGTWLAIVIVMAIATGFSAVSVMRGFSANSVLTLR